MSLDFWLSHKDYRLKEFFVKCESDNADGNTEPS